MMRPMPTREEIEREDRAARFIMAVVMAFVTTYFMSIAPDQQPPPFLIDALIVIGLIVIVSMIIFYAIILTYIWFDNRKYGFYHK